MTGWELRSEVATAARRLAGEGLLIGTAGNVSSVDPATGNVAVTATGIVLAECRPEDVTVISRDGTVLTGTLAPTSEIDLHLAVIEAYDAGAVVHTHAPAATALGCVRDDLPVLHYQQLLLGGVIRVAPYATFGSAELAANAVAALTDRSAALLANHGTVNHARTLAEAVEGALLLEWCSRLFLDASSLGTPRALDQDQQNAVIEAAITRRYGSTQPLPQEGTH